MNGLVKLALLLPILAALVGTGCSKDRGLSFGNPSVSQPAMSHQGSGANDRAAMNSNLAQQNSPQQKNCPVTGEALGSMGKPIPVSANGQTIYVCCQGCVKKVKNNPDKYLAIVQASGA